MRRPSRKLVVEAGPAEREGHRAPAGGSDGKELKTEPCPVDAAAPAGAKPGSFETGAPDFAALRRGLATPRPSA